MPSRTAPIAMIAAVLLLLASGARAQGGPADLTGTWEGKVSCKFNIASNGETGSFKTDVELRIRQVTAGANGTQLAVVFEDPNTEVAYSGRTIDTGSGKGQLTFVRCGSEDSAWTTPTEIWKAKWSVKAENGKGSISGTAVFNEANGGAGQGTLSTCKGSWKRIDTAAPTAPGCGG